MTSRITGPGGTLAGSRVTFHSESFTWTVLGFAASAAAARGARAARSARPNESWDTARMNRAARRLRIFRTAFMATSWFGFLVCYVPRIQTGGPTTLFRGSKRPSKREYFRCGASLYGGKRPRDP